MYCLYLTEYAKSVKQVIHSIATNINYILVIWMWYEKTKFPTEDKQGSLVQLTGLLQENKWQRSVADEL